MTAGPFGENTIYFLGFGLIIAVCIFGVAVRIVRYLWSKR
jgi:hypothetical protein